MNAGGAAKGNAGAQAPNIQSVVNADLYNNPMPMIDGVKQVIQALEDKIQPLTPAQLQAIGYLDMLQDRAIHAGKKPYQKIIDRIINDAPKVAPPGYFVRVIEALVPRPLYVDGKTFEKMNKEKDAK
jgi:hypothetical protein